ncbi:hypothetical protein Gasu2_34720 [Galdieria sulphuraria]|nr:hypothetical protein Gasu2_34720 [Galdieria sulphuraria]
MSISSTAHSSSGELSGKSEFGAIGVSLETLDSKKIQKHTVESSWRRRVHNQHDVERISVNSLKIVPQRVFCFEKFTREFQEGEDSSLWLFTERNIQLYGLDGSDCRYSIPLPDSDISYVKTFYFSSGSIQVPLRIRGIMAIGLKNGDCVLYDGYTGTCLQTLSPPTKLSNKVGVSVLGYSGPSICPDLNLRDQEQADFLLIGFKNNSFAEWQLDWKIQTPCSSEILYKEWSISYNSCSKDAHYLSYLRLWIILIDRDILFMDEQGSVIYCFSMKYDVSKLLVMDPVFLSEQKDRKILILTISEEGFLQYSELHYLATESLRLEPLDSSFLSFKDCMKICCFSQLCCNYFILGSSDGSLSLFQWNQTSLGSIMPVCLHKKVIHSEKFDFISCKRENDGFIIRTYCPVDNQLITASIVVKHKPECRCLLTLTNPGCHRSDSSNCEEKFYIPSYKQDVENEESYHRSAIAFSSKMERLPELSNITEEMKQLPLLSHDQNENNVVYPSSNKQMSCCLTEAEQRLQLLQTEYEYEKKIHQRLRDELLNRALEAEEQVERLEAKLKEMQRMKRHQNEGLKEENFLSQSVTSNQDLDRERLALLEKQLQEALDSKQLLMVQAKEDINYLQNRVEALDAVLLSTQRDSEDFISTTVEMNERIAEALDGLTDEAFDQLGGFEEVFRQWMTTVREKLHRQRKRTEEIKEEIHTLQNMFRVIDHSATNLTQYEKTMQEENSPTTDVADATPRSRLLLHQIAMAHDRLLEDNAALETENERLQLQLRRAVEAASYYSGRDTVSSPLEPTTPREDHASTSSKN